MKTESIEFSIRQIDLVISKLESLKEDVNKLESLDKYAEKKLMIEMKKVSIIAQTTLI